jgi:putative ABC transport system permease protein
MRIIETMRQDASTGVRMLRRSSGFTIAAIVTLAVGIGANTAIFSLINAALLEPLPYPEADRIVQLWLTAPNGGGLTLSIPEVNILTRQTDVFEDVAAYDFGGPGVNVNGVGEAEQVKAIHASAAYFRLFGAHVEFGRTFQRRRGQAEWRAGCSSQSRIVASPVWRRSHSGGRDDFTWR